MNRRHFLVAGGLLAGSATLATGGFRAAKPAQLHVGFAPPGGTSLLPASRVASADSAGADMELLLALHGAENVAEGLLVEASVGTGPRFHVAGVRRRDGLVHVSAARRFEAKGEFALHAGGHSLGFGAAGLPLRRGTYVIVLAAEAPRWHALQLGPAGLTEAGTPIDTPHLVLGLDRAAPALV